MQYIIKFSMILIMFFLSSCQDLTYEFRRNVQGTYQLVDSTQIITIDATGSIAGTPQSQLIFYQAKSPTDGIYIKREGSKNYYVSIRIDGVNLYYGAVQPNAHSVTFDNMILFAKKIS